MKTKIFAAITALLSVGILVLGIPAQAMSMSSNTTLKTALAVNAQNGEFDYLIKAIQLTGLGSAVDGKRQLTVFAPTDAAFESTLGLTNPTQLSGVPVETLKSILLYHVAPGYRPASSVVESSRIRTLNGGFINVNGTVLNGGTNILSTDIKTSNGVIHVIDSVLLP
jgi:uncharacterized surface protein with fasciclin (FAS1) repeats